MTHPILATCLLALAVIACSLTPVPVSHPKQEQAAPMFTEAFVRHNIEVRGVYHLDAAKMSLDEWKR